MDTADTTTPEPEYQRVATQAEKEARIDQVIRWMDDGIKGKKLAQKVAAEFEICEGQAYNYVKYANEKLAAQVKMTDEELDDFIQKNFLEIARHRDKRLALQAMKELAKLRGRYKPQKIEVSTPYDGLAQEDLDKLAKERGLE